MDWVVWMLYCRFDNFHIFKPGLRPPERNPLQVFKNSHPFEWYDSNAELQFPFAEAYADFPINVVLVWGIEPSMDVSHYNPRDRGKIKVKSNFNLTSLESLKQLNDVCTKIREQDFVSPAFIGSK